MHGGVQKLVQELNRIYEPEAALWEVDDEPAGFEWLDVDNAAENIVAFIRRSSKTAREIVCVCNFSAVPKKGYRLALPQKYKVVINTDAEIYGGSGNAVDLVDDLIDLPPLTTIWLVGTQKAQKKKATKSTKDRKKSSDLV